RRAVEEAFNRGNLAVLDELVAPDFVNRSAPHALTNDRQGYRRFVEMYRSAFPDLQVAIDEQTADGDQVTTRWTARGTRRGERMGIPPTGRQVTMTGVNVDRVVGGKVVESSSSSNVLALMQQLGVVPTSEAPEA